MSRNLSRVHRLSCASLAAAPLLFTFLFFTTECPGNRDGGFFFSLKLGRISITASRCC